MPVVNRRKGELRYSYMTLLFGEATGGRRAERVRGPAAEIFPAGVDVPRAVRD